MLYNRDRSSITSLLLLSIISLLSGNSFAIQFNIMTYNVQMRPVLDDNVYKGERISRKLNDYDIVAIQESFAEKDLLLKHVNHPHSAHFTEKRALALVDSGLSTLSRFPIVMTKKEHYGAFSGIADSVASKGIMLTRMIIDGMVLDVYNTHMQAGADDKQNEARLEQAGHVVDFINRHSPTTHSVIVIGDFNMSPVRPGRAFADFEPNHYSNPRDMMLRTQAFQTIVDNLNLTDAQDTILSRQFDDIDRVLFRSGCGHELRPTSLFKDDRRFVDEHGKSLSDSSPLVTNFSFERNGLSCAAAPIVAPVPDPNEVRFFRHCNYEGPWFRMKPQQTRNLAAEIVFHDSISAVKIGSNVLALLSEHADGSGQQICVSDTVACMHGHARYGALHDAASRIKVFSRTQTNLPPACQGIR